MLLRLTVDDRCVTTQFFLAAYYDRLNDFAKLLGNMQDQRDH